MNDSMDQATAKPSVSYLFIIVVSLFITCLLISNIIAVKITNIAGLSLPASVIVFPISFIINDVLTEVYGYAQARRVTWIGFSCNLIAVIFILISIRLEPNQVWKYQEGYEQTLGYTPRILLASFPAYLVGVFANSFVMSKMKLATKGRWLWTRTIGSTIVGETLDTMVFLTIAFVGTIPSSVLLQLIATQAIFHISYEILATPLTYRVIKFIKEKENMDVYDHHMRYNPFSLGGAQNSESHAR